MHAAAWEREQGWVATLYRLCEAEGREWFLRTLWFKTSHDAAVQSWIDDDCKKITAEASSYEGGPQTIFHSSPK